MLPETRRRTPEPSPKQVPACNPYPTSSSPLAQLVASPATLASWATWPPTRFAAIAGVASVLADGPSGSNCKRIWLSLAWQSSHPRRLGSGSRSGRLASIRRRPGRTAPSVTERPPRPWSPDCCSRDRCSDAAQASGSPAIAFARGGLRTARSQCLQRRRPPGRRSATPMPPHRAVAACCCFAGMR
jgi:hypothetical protein